MEVFVEMSLFIKKKIGGGYVCTLYVLTVTKQISIISVAEHISMLNIAEQIPIFVQFISIINALKNYIMI